MQWKTPALWSILTRWRVKSNWNCMVAFRMERAHKGSVFTDSMPDYAQYLYGISTFLIINKCFPRDATMVKVKFHPLCNGTAGTDSFILLSFSTPLFDGLSSFSRRLPVLSVPLCLEGSSMWTTMPMLMMYLSLWCGKKATLTDKMPPCDLFLLVKFQQFTAQS